MNILKFPFLAGCMLICAAASADVTDSAVICRRIAADRNYAGVNKYVYDHEPQTYTRAPKGYKLFYLSHYGRHGSRTQKGDTNFNCVIDALEAAKAEGILTPQGDSLLSETIRMKEIWGGMDGRLTPRGQREHTGIASRMVGRTGRLLKGKDAHVNAICSTVPRSMVSMCAFENELCRLNPSISILNDAGEVYQKYIAGTNYDKKSPAAKGLRMRKSADSLAILPILFTDPGRGHAIAGSADRLTRAMVENGVDGEDMDMPDDALRYVPISYLYNYWEYNSRSIVLKRFPSGNPRLVEDIVTKADEAIAGTSGAVADLRFGHDYPLVGLAHLLGLSEFADVTVLHDCSELVRMASNLQIEFYRNSTGRVLVKFIYNEKEKTIEGLDPVEGPYYDWESYKTYLKTR